MEYNSIYGAILIQRDYAESVKFLKSLGKDSTYPFINTNMFSFGDYEPPYYYENVMLSFGATYRSFGLDIDDWNKLILKIEHILRNIGFKTAQFHVESYLGDFTLFWMHADRRFYADDNYKSSNYELIKTSEWYFGFGKRALNNGFLDNPLQIYDKLGNDFVYPVMQDR